MSRNGTAHDNLRKQWAPLVAAGQVTCWRCGKPIQPGDDWDLGHDDHDRTKYRGPEHLKCNRATRSHRAPKRRQQPRAIGLGDST